MVLHLAVISRNLVVGSAVSQAFLCAVSALFLVYVSAVLDVESVGRYFKMPSVGLLTLDAVIGLAWFAAAILSGVGMALSFIKQAPGEKRARSTLLMFHRYGVHLVVIIPCIAIMSGVFARVVCVCVWSVHLVYMAASLLVDADMTQLVLKKDESFQSLDRVQQMLFLFVYILHLIFRFAAVFISLLVLIFVDTGYGRRVLVFCLLGVAGLTSIDAFSPLIVSCFPSLPALDGYFSADWEREHSSESNDAPVDNKLPTTMGSRYTSIPSPFLQKYADPAAVLLLQREKMV
jgi:hypothetical protein